MTHSNRMPEDLLEFQSLEISKNRSGKHLSELTSTADSACREKNRWPPEISSNLICLWFWGRQQFSPPTSVWVFMEVLLRRAFANMSDFFYKKTGLLRRSRIFGWKCHLQLFVIKELTQQMDPLATVWLADGFEFLGFHWKPWCIPQHCVQVRQWNTFKWLSSKYHYRIWFL